jgi:HEPN domain-containing protein
MMEEVRFWLKKGERDLDSARFNLEGKRYDVAAFLSQQAAEKALKALYILKHKELWKIHDLVKLGEKLSAPNDILALCEKLTQHYITARYNIDAEYTESDVREAINDSSKVIEWTRKKLKS